MCCSSNLNLARVVDHCVIKKMIKFMSKIVSISMFLFHANGVTML